MDIAERLRDVADELPIYDKHGAKTIRDVALVLNDDSSWDCLAGGHSAVHIGEWGGTYRGTGDTAEEAIEDCMKGIKGHAGSR